MMLLASVAVFSIPIYEHGVSVICIKSFQNFLCARNYVFFLIT
jgi:hypothetical protein